MMAGLSLCAAGLARQKSESQSAAPGLKIFFMLAFRWIVAVSLWLAAPSEPLGLKGRAKRSERETTTNGRSKVVVVVIGDAGAVWNGDGETAAHVGVRNAGKNVEAPGEVMIRVE